MNDWIWHILDGAGWEKFLNQAWKQGTFSIACVWEYHGETVILEDFCGHSKKSDAGIILGGKHVSVCLCFFRFKCVFRVLYLPRLFYDVHLHN